MNISPPPHKHALINHRNVNFIVNSARIERGNALGCFHPVFPLVRSTHAHGKRITSNLHRGDLEQCCRTLGFESYPPSKEIFCLAILFTTVWWIAKNHICKKAFLKEHVWSTSLLLYCRMYCKKSLLFSKRTFLAKLFIGVDCKSHTYKNLNA